MFQEIMTYGSRVWKFVRMGMLSCSLLSCLCVLVPRHLKDRSNHATDSVNILCVGLGEKGLSTPSCWTIYGTLWCCWTTLRRGKMWMLPE